MNVSAVVSGAEAAKLANLRRDHDALLSRFSAARRAYHDALLAVYPIQPGDRLVAKSGKVALVRLTFVAFGQVVVRAAAQHAEGGFGERDAPLHEPDWADPVVVRGDKPT